MTKALRIVCLCLAVLGLALTGSGCSAGKPVLIDRMTVMKVPPSHMPPTGHFAPVPDEPVPQSGVVGAPYHPGEKIFIILSVNKDLTDNVTFSRFTLYDQQTKEETDLPYPENLEPFEPGQIFWVAFDDNWQVPDMPGTYELRVYVGDKNTIFATFTVD